MESEPDFTILIVLSAIVLLLVVSYLSIISCEALASNGYFKRCRWKPGSAFKRKRQSGVISLVEVHSRNDPLVAENPIVSKQDESVRKRDKASASGYVEVVNSLYEPWMPRLRENFDDSCQKIVQCEVHGEPTKKPLSRSMSTTSSTNGDPFDTVPTSSKTVSKTLSSFSGTAEASGVQTDMDSLSVVTVTGNKTSHSGAMKKSDITSVMDPMTRDSYFVDKSYLFDSARASGVPSHLSRVIRDSILENSKTSTSSETTSAVGIPSDVDSWTRDSLCEKMPFYSGTTRISGIPSDVDPIIRDCVSDDGIHISSNSTCISTSVIVHSDIGHPASIGLPSNSPVYIHTGEINANTNDVDQITRNSVSRKSSMHSRRESRETEDSYGPMTSPITEDSLIRDNSLTQDNVSIRIRTPIPLNTTDPGYVVMRQAGKNSLVDDIAMCSDARSRLTGDTNKPLQPPACDGYITHGSGAPLTDSLIGNTSLYSLTPRSSDIPSDNEDVNKEHKSHETVTLPNPSVLRVRFGQPVRDSLIGNTSLCSLSPRTSNLPSGSETITEEDVIVSNTGVTTPISSVRHNTNCQATGDNFPGNTSFYSASPRTNDAASDTDSASRDNAFRHSLAPLTTRSDYGKEVARVHRTQNRSHGSAFSVSSDWFASEWAYNPCYDSIDEMK